MFLQTGAQHPPSPPINYRFLSSFIFCYTQLVMLEGSPRTTTEASPLQKTYRLITAMAKRSPEQWQRSPIDTTITPPHGLPLLVTGESYTTVFGLNGSARTVEIKHVTVEPISQLKGASRTVVKVAILHPDDQSVSVPVPLPEEDSTDPEEQAILHALGKTVSTLQTFHEERVAKFQATALDDLSDVL